MGHVDHGKTTLLDWIRKSHVADKETGGITQHIGAYEIVEKGEKITFIDTPGHEAFSAMRARGAKVADIAVLVVAADEGVQPQTKEAILHIKKAGIPMIAAINKIDKAAANPEKIKRELSAQDILVESMGGKIPSVEVSATTGKGINELLELILLVAEMEDLKADIQKPAQGVIIESYLDSNRGPTTTLILQKGILKKNDILGTATALGKIKTLEDFQGNPIEKTLPSMPVIVLGFESVPGVGESFKVFSDIESAKNEIKEPEKSTVKMPAVESDKKSLNLILKVDVLGSLEAIEQVLKVLPQEKVFLRILKAEVGTINESDVKLSIGTKAKIVGFRVKINPIAQNLAQREKVTIMTFDIIYELAQAVRQILEKKVAPEVVRVDLGKVKVLVIFLIEKSRQIVGGKVIEGVVKRGASLEVYRNEEKVGKGKIIELQRNKKEIDEVGKGTECGILYEGDAKIEKGDVLLVYKEERRKGEL